MDGARGEVKLFSSLVVFFFLPLAAAYGAAPEAALPPGAQPGGPGVTPFQFIFGTVQFFLVAFFIYFWMAIRPQQLRDDERKKFTAELKKNDEVMTSGGIFGKVISTKDDSVTIDVGAGVKLRVHIDHVTPPPPVPAATPADAQKNQPQTHRTTEQ